MEKSLRHSVVIFPTVNKPSVIAEPSNGSLNLPAAFVTSKGPAILKFLFFIFPRRSHKLNASLLETLAKLIRVIGFVSNQVFRFFAKLINGFIMKVRVQ